MQLAALFITVNRSKLCIPNRQILIRPWFGFIHFAMVRAVHRLQEELLSFLRCLYWLEAILAVFFIVTRSHIQILMPNMRRNYLFVARFHLGFTHKVNQAFAQGGAFG